jgi:hypothetical protein
MINDNPDKPWDWSGVSRNPNITMQMINGNPNKPWEWNYISRNPNLTMQMIIDNPDKPWDWFYISSNPNITWQMITDNPNKPWDWENISFNKFSKNKIVNGRLLKKIQRRSDCYDIISTIVIKDIAFVIALYL